MYALRGPACLGGLDSCPGCSATAPAWPVLPFRPGWRHSSATVGLTGALALPMLLYMLPSHLHPLNHAISFLLDPAQVRCPRLNQSGGVWAREPYQETPLAELTAAFCPGMLDLDLESSWHLTDLSISEAS